MFLRVQNKGVTLSRVGLISRVPGGWQWMGQDIMYIWKMATIYQFSRCQTPYQVFSHGYFHVFRIIYEADVIPNLRIRKFSLREPINFSKVKQPILQKRDAKPGLCDPKLWAQFTRPHCLNWLKAKNDLLLRGTGISGAQAQIVAVSDIRKSTSSPFPLAEHISAHWSLESALWKNKNFQPHLYP